MKMVFFVSLIYLIVISVFPRSVELLNKNYLFLFDQGRDYLAVRNIVVDHKLTLIGSEIGAGSAGFSYIFHGPGYYYLLSIPFLIFKGDPYGGIVLMWFLSISAIIFGFILGKRLFKNTFFGIILAIMIAISPPLISQARFVWNSHPTTPLILIFYISVFLINKRPAFIFLSAFLAGIIYNFELAIAVPLSVGLLFYLIFIHKARDLKSYALLFLGFLFSYSPMILFDVRHGLPGTRNLLNYLVHGSTSSSIAMGRNLIDHFQSFSLNLVDTFPTSKAVPMVMVFLMIYGLSLLFIRKEKNKVLKEFMSFMIILPVITFIVFAVLRNSVWVYYLIHLNIAYIILFTYLLFFSWKNQKKNFTIGLSLVFILFCIFASVRSFNTTKADYYDYGGNAKIKGRIDALDYIYKDAKGKPFGFFVFSPPVYTYPYDYLIEWYAKDKYGYAPYSEKKGTFYLLIEKDPYKPSSYKGWLETVIKTGSVAYTKTLQPSGLILQKRQE